MKKNLFLILFDLDGVLFNGHKLQEISTVTALKIFKVKITVQIKSLINQTLTTKEKLKILSRNNIIKKKDIKKIYFLKKKIFYQKSKKKINYSKSKFLLIKYLIKNDFKVGVVTNTNKKAAYYILKKMKIFKLLNIIVTNEDEVKPKPNPGPYNLAIKKMNVRKNQTLIFEDSPVGILSAQRSGAFFVKVKKVREVNKNFVKKKIKFYESL